MASLKGQVKYLCAGVRFEKWVKADFSNELFLPDLSILVVEYFSGRNDQPMIVLSGDWLTDWFTEDN